MEAKLGIEQQDRAGGEADVSGNGENPGGIGGVVLGLMESGSGRASIKGIVYALTLERQIPNSLFMDITNELRAMQDRGEIVEAKSGKYHLPGEEDISESDASTAQQNGKPQRKGLSKKDKTELDRMMLEAFGKIGVRPKMSRRNQLNPRRKRKRDTARKRY